MPAAARAEPGGDTLAGPLAYVLLIAAMGVALISMLLAALPLGALERLLAGQAHLRTEQVAIFVDGHRIDIAVAGVAMLVVVAVVALPTVAG